MTILLTHSKCSIGGYQIKIQKNGCPNTINPTYLNKLYNYDKELFYTR